MVGYTRGESRQVGLHMSSFEAKNECIGSTEQLVSMQRARARNNGEGKPLDAGKASRLQVELGCCCMVSGDQHRRMATQTFTDTGT